MCHSLHRPVKRSGGQPCTGSDKIYRTISGNAHRCEHQAQLAAAMLLPPLLATCLPGSAPSPWTATSPRQNRGPWATGTPHAAEQIVKASGAATCGSWHPGPVPATSQKPSPRSGRHPRPALINQDQNSTHRTIRPGRHTHEGIGLNTCGHLTIGSTVWGLLQNRLPRVPGGGRRVAAFESGS